MNAHRERGRMAEMYMLMLIINGMNKTNEWDEWTVLHGIYNNLWSRQKNSAGCLYTIFVILWKWRSYCRLLLRHAQSDDSRFVFTSDNKPIVSCHRFNANFSFLLEFLFRFTPAILFARHIRTHMHQILDYSATKAPFEMEQNSEKSYT